MSVRHRTAWIAEDSLRRPVRYSVHVDEPADDGARFVEQGPLGASVDECVEWALSRAGQAVIRFGNAMFLAGTRRDPGQEELATWPPPVDVRERVERDVEALAARMAAEGMVSASEGQAGPWPPASLPPDVPGEAKGESQGWTDYVPRGRCGP